MNIYAIWDRMLKYYQPAFFATEDKQVLAALAQTVNSTEKTNAITQAPHHFELWQIGHIHYAELQDKTTLYTDNRLVATLDSLLRGGVRKDTGPNSYEMAVPAKPSSGNTRSTPQSGNT